MEAVVRIRKARDAPDAHPGLPGLGIGNAALREQPRSKSLNSRANFRLSPPGQRPFGPAWSLHRQHGLAILRRGRPRFDVLATPECLEASIVRGASRATSWSALAPPPAPRCDHPVETTFISLTSLNKKGSRKETCISSSSRQYRAAPQSTWRSRTRRGTMDRRQPRQLTLEEPGPRRVPAALGHEPDGISFKG